MRIRRFACLFLIVTSFWTNSVTAAPTRPQAIDFDFVQKFSTIHCPADAPIGYLCLNVTGNAAISAIGQASFTREVLIDIKRFDEKHPTCIPDETVGTATLPKGTITFHAPGSVCLADGTASYGLVVTGGTGAYKGAVGGGRITVPPPTSDSGGRELWHVELYLTA